jgi:hypothetical protein
MSNCSLATTPPKRLQRNPDIICETDHLVAAAATPQRRRDGIKSIPSPCQYQPPPSSFPRGHGGVDALAIINRRRTAAFLNIMKRLCFRITSQAKENHGASAQI